LVTKKCLREVGFFEPLFSHRGEDCDYVNRAIYHGFKVGICTQLRGFHEREQRLLAIKKSESAHDAYMNFLATILNINIPIKTAFSESVFACVKKLLRLILKLDVLAIKYLMLAIISFPTILKHRKNNKVRLK